jgi:hypothetical protein
MAGPLSNFANYDPDALLNRLNSGPGEVTVQPARLVAGTDSQSGQALGRPLPIVVGTGRVDGVYFIGGVQQIDTVTTTDTWTSQDITEYAGGIFATNISRGGNTTGTGGAFLTGPLLPVYSKVTTSTTTSEMSTLAGYVLAYDFYETGYDLIRVEVDDQVVYDAENGIAATHALRFYGGQHLNPDPILQQMIGDNAGAYRNFVMLFLDGYPADAPPNVSCVISNATSDSGGIQRIEWTGTVPVTFGDPFAYGTAYDPVDGIIYHLLEEDDIPGAGAYQLAVLDVDTHLERYRVALADTSAYFGSNGRPQIMALRGSGHILAEFHMGSPGPLNGRNRIYDAVTGAIVAEHVDSATEEMRWVAGLPFGQLYVFMGWNRHAGEGQQIHFGVADLAAGTFTIEEGSIGYEGPPAWGRPASANSVSFYSSRYGADTEVHEHTFNGDTWTSALVFTAANPVRGLHFDPQTGYLVVTSVVASVDGHVDYVNPVTGAVIDAFDPGVILSNHLLITGFERLWARPGYALFWTSTSVISLLNIQDRTVAVFTDNGAVAPNWVGVIFDHNKLAYYSYYGDTNWTEYMLPGSAPRLLDLDDVVTDVMHLAGFGPSDLTFSGFTGIQTWGFVIASDTTIQNAVRPLADTYGFSWADTGSGFYFKKAGQDGLLSVDMAFDASDIVERDQPVQTLDEANIRTPSAIEMEYQSKEGLYKPRPTSFSMTTGVLNSITTPRFSTPILLNDAEAQRICVEKFFEYQEKRRSHGLVVAPEHIVALPGDIVSFPSGLITYTARVEQVAVDLRNLGIEISARDFQTEVATTVTSVSNNSLVTVQVYYASQYLHLDMPLFRNADDTAGASLVQYGVVAPRGQVMWSGGTLYRGPLATALAAIFNQSPHQGIVGVCTTVMNAPLDPFALDDASTVTIRRITADTALLVDATEDEVLAGANNALIGIDGRWEWVGFKTVVDNLDGTYTLSGFTLRGYRGSEVFCARHETNDVFVTIDFAWLRRANHPVADLGNTLYYLAAGIGQNPAVSATIPHVITGAAETPYACVNLDAVEASPDGIDISWDYRSRIASGFNPVNFGEETLAFEVDIYDTDGTTYLRTLTSTTNSVHYATADVVSDFGSDPPPVEMWFRVFMMSALPILVPGQDRPVEGRGYEARGRAIFAVEVIGQSLTVSVGTVSVTAITVTGAPVTGQSLTASVGTVTVIAGEPALMLVDARTDPDSVSFTKTMTSVSFGTEDGSRIIAVMLTGAGLSHTISGVTIGGVAATLGAKTTSDHSAAVYFRAVPTGASGTVEVTVTDTATIYTTVVALYGVAPSVFDSDTLVIGGFATSFNKSIDADDGGIVLGVFGDTDKTVDVTWTNLDELNDLYPGGANQRHTTAYEVVTSAATISVTAATPSNVGGSLTLVSFGSLAGGVPATAGVTGQSVTASVGTAAVTITGPVAANATGQSVTASVGTVTVTTGGTATDPNFASVKLLLGFDGTDAATSTTDESGSPHAMTFVGNAQIDTAQQKFGSASLLLDGNGDRLTTPDSADWDFGSGAFTIECFARFRITETGANVICSQYATGSRAWAFDYFSNTLRLSYSTSGTGTTATLTFAWTQSGGTWFHLAVTRDGSGNVRAFVDGTQVGSTQAAAVTFFNSTASLWVGAIETATPGNDFDGWIDELRITKGVARYTANFTAPTAAFPRS